MSNHGHAGWQKRDAFKDSTTADAERSSSAHGNGRRRVHSTSRSNHSEPPNDEQPRAACYAKGEQRISRRDLGWDATGFSQFAKSASTRASTHARDTEGHSHTTA